MLIASIFAVAFANGRLQPLKAETVLRHFSREFCINRPDRVNRLKRWGINGWQVSPNSNGPVAFHGEVVPKNNSYSIQSRGRIRGGDAWINASSTEIIDPHPSVFRSSYAASLYIKPEALINQKDIEKALGMKLIADDVVIENPGIITISGGGEPTKTTKPYSRWMQHYYGGDTFNDTVSITARRMWGDIGNQQSWYISCGSYQAPIRPRDR